MCQVPMVKSLHLMKNYLYFLFPLEYFQCVAQYSGKTKTKTRLASKSLAPTITV